MKEIKLEKIFGMQVLDSRGTPTIFVEAEAMGKVGRAYVPSGASTGSFEAVELRDEHDNIYFGKSVLNAVENINNTIANAIIGMNIFNQEKLDMELIKLDGTPNKKNLGANAILGVSLAVANLASKIAGMPLFRYIGGINSYKLPMPMMNILNGGRHANNNLSIQEFMIIPKVSDEFSQNLRVGVEIYHHLKKTLKEAGHNIGIGDEGGFAPNLKSEEEAIEFILYAIEAAGYEAGSDVFLALDVAATEMYEEAKKLGEEEAYYFWKNEVLKTRGGMIDYLEGLLNKYPIISIEDGLAEEDWKGWGELTNRLGSKVQLVGDDLFVTNSERLKRGIDEGVANSILIKPNQIGTLTETLRTIELAKENGYKTIISHRSGETEDTTIADIAVATNSGQIKTGAPCRTDRVSKYNRLLYIENLINLS